MCKLRIVLFCVNIVCISSIPLDLFYPFGDEFSDLTVPQGDDTSTKEIHLQVPVTFYNRQYSSLFVNTNGHISFESEFPFYQADMILPIGSKIIAAYFSDVDTNRRGTIFFRETTESAELQRASADIRTHFADFSTFQAESVFIATWEGVGYYNEPGNQENTFQIVLITDGTDSFALFHYLIEGLQWKRSLGKSTPILEDPPAQAGFDSGLGLLHLKLPLSGTLQVEDLSSTSNVNIPGQWMFHIGDVGDGNVKQADLYTGEEFVFEVDEEAESCLNGARSCHPSARCVDYNPGFCCECVAPFYGNGKSCLEPGVPQRLNGKVTVTLSDGITHQLDQHSYVVTSDGRSYTAISRIPVEIGPSMQILNTMDGIVGWLFAVPTTPKARNGYMLTGGVFNRTAHIRFPSGEAIDIRQYFFGHDALNNMRVASYINGTMPAIPAGAAVKVDTFNDEYRRVDIGIIKSTSARTYRINDIGYRYTVDQNILYNECTHDPSRAFKDALRMMVSRTFVVYDPNEHIVRYAMTTKVGSMAITDPCRNAIDVCGRNARCVVLGDDYKCECDPGFQGDGLTCNDLDECSLSAPCHPNAQCFNSIGSYQCQCHPGYRGDGYSCELVNDRLCGEVTCDENARCVFNVDLGAPTCECIPNYFGDGVTCERRDSGERLCGGIHCDRNALCVFNPETQAPICQCNPGFVGTGEVCRVVEFACNEVNNCDENAVCLYDQTDQRYRCVCNEGYSGDGESCAETFEPGINCRDCDENARCMYDIDRFVYHCQCRDGFTGDGHSCTRLDGCDQCHPNSQCQYEPTEGRYVCRCHPGYRGDGYQCQALDCSTTRDCDVNAQCIPDAVLRVYRCQCNPGYGGDGYACQATAGCEVLADCSANGQCIQDINDISRYGCVCDRGFEGDGYECRAIGGCNVFNDCGQRAQCVQDPRDLDRWGCVCERGFEGDGYRCEPTGCNVYNDCSENGQCIQDPRDPERYGCVCNRGYRGDGYRCDGGACAGPNECSADAECVEDPNDPQIYGCHCRQGFEGDGRICIQRIVPCNQVNNCDPHAECLHDPDSLSYHCRCRPGYEGTGIVCRKREEDCRRTPTLCDQNASCIHNAEVYLCVCNQGYTGNGRSCYLVTYHADYLLYAQGMSILQVPPSEDPTGVSAKQLLYLPGSTAVGIDYDCTDRHFYWTDVTLKSISRARLDGSNSETLLEGADSPEGVAIDWVSRNMYWTDSGKNTIEVARLDGSHRKTLFSEGLVNPRAIVLDPGKGVFYWSDWNRSSPKIERANMDGTDRQTFVEYELGLPNALSLDIMAQQLCWGDAGTQRLECIRTDGIGRRTIYGLAAYPFSLAAVGHNFYWTDWEMKSIPNIARNGGEPNEALTLPVGGNGKLYGVVAVSDTCPRVTNACALNNGGCSFLCLPSPHGGRSCACPDDVDPNRCNEINEVRKRRK